MNVQHLQMELALATLLGVSFLCGRAEKSLGGLSAQGEVRRRLVLTSWAAFWGLQLPGHGAGKLEEKHLRVLPL